MSKVEIVKNPYKTICDTYGCSNIGEFMIGKPGENLGFHRIVCKECLQETINAAPIEMVLNRPEFDEEELQEKFMPEDANGKLEGEQDCGNDKKELDKPPEEFNWNDVSFAEVKKIAAEKGLKFQVGMSKNDLIEYIEGAK